MSLSKYEAKRIGKKVKLAKSPPISEFPADVLKYMKENATPKQIIKSMNVIKYFIPKECPFTYFGNENFDECAFLDENNLTIYTSGGIKYILNDLPKNLGISGKLSVLNGMALPILISKIIVCDIKILCLCTPRITFGEFKFLTASGKLKELELIKTIIIWENGIIVPYEILLGHTPYLRFLKMTYNPQKRLSKKIVEKICELNLEILVLDRLTDDFKLESFLVVVAKKKPNLDIHIRFLCSVNTFRNINLYMDKVISSGFPASFPPHIDFCYMVFQPHVDCCCCNFHREAYENVRKAYRQSHFNLIN
uniref:Uncharacterized protein n=1 Tax=Panagrolaimus sp. PS1159 TaxID=55785 RepID=A0AC35FTJ5_9BILA